MIKLGITFVGLFQTKNLRGFCVYIFAFLPGIKRSVVSSLPVPLPVIVVAHDVDEVEVFVHLRNVVRDVDRRSRGADGGREDVVVLVHRDLQVLDEGDEVFLVFRFATSFAFK